MQQTLSELLMDGLLVRQRGRGAFAAQPKLTYNAASGIEVNDEMREQGFALGWRLLDSQWIPAPIYAAQALTFRLIVVYLAEMAKIGGRRVDCHHMRVWPERWAQRINVERLTDGGFSCLFFAIFYPRKILELNQLLKRDLLSAN